MIVASGAAGSSSTYQALRTAKSTYYVAQSNDKEIVFSVPDGYFACIVEYDEDGTFVKRAGNFTKGAAEQTMEAIPGYKYRFTFGKPGEDMDAILNAEFLADVTCTIKRLILDSPVVIKYKSEFPLQIGY